MLPAARPAGAETLRTEQEWFARCSLQYRMVFDREHWFFIGRAADGGGRAGDEFDPAEWGGDYTETNAWGGRCSPFRAAEPAWTTRTAARSASCLFGTPDLSNQPVHHIPSFPMFAGFPEDPRRMVRGFLEHQLVGSALGQGYPGRRGQQRDERLVRLRDDRAQLTGAIDRARMSSCRRQSPGPPCDCLEVRPPSSRPRPAPRARTSRPWPPTAPDGSREASRAACGQLARKSYSRCRRSRRGGLPTADRCLRRSCTGI
jgi:hypothetical protein